MDIVANEKKMPKPPIENYTFTLTQEEVVELRRWAIYYRTDGSRNTTGRFNKDEDCALRFLNQTAKACPEMRNCRAEYLFLDRIDQ